MAAELSDLGEDLRPLVATGSHGNYGLWVFLAIMLLGGGWLFATLNSAREAANAPAMLPVGERAGRITAPPPLVLPAAQRMLPRDVGPETPAAEPARQAVPTYFMPPQGPVPQGPPPTYSPPSQAVVEQPPVPGVVYARNPAPSGAGLADEVDPNRVSATRLANPSMTVPQGTMIPAVLETAFDSTRPGGVRALVQRDIYSFDGSRVLVPRGSRLFGEYEAGINPGERRALITWKRLMRPDGASIALDSPAADPLGRAGVGGDVNSRFFARFGGALLQTVLGIGASVATSEATGGVIVALPGSTQTVTGTSSERVRPVLHIDHGTSVSVFVARDLDFSTVDN